MKEQQETEDSAPIISSSTTPPIEPVKEGEDVSISSEELKELSQAVLSLKTDQDTLEELKEERGEYIEVCIFMYVMQEFLSCYRCL